MVNDIILGILIVNVLGFIFLWKRDQNALYAIFGVSLLALFVFSVMMEYTQEWRTYQKQFVQMQIEKESDPLVVDTLKRTPIKILQTWTPELRIADRCITCHLAINDPRFKDAPEPFRYHRAAREHDFKKIGCTICHSGQGRATEAKYAHAKDIGHWDYPMLENNMVQLSCPQCHEQLYRSGYQLKGADMIAMARDLTEVNEMDVECTSCHTIRGFGEVLAPDLTEFGTRTEHEFEQTHEMEYVEGKHNIYNWTFQHFLDPEKITPGNEETGVEATIMPNFEFTDEQAHALTTYVFSFKQSKIPANYQYKEPTRKEKALKDKIPFIEEFQESFENLDEMTAGQKIFIRANCWFCHTIDGKGGTIGPNLSKVGGKYKSKAGLLKFFEGLPNAESSKGKKRHPMAARLKKFSEEQFDQLAEYLASRR